MTSVTLKYILIFNNLFTITQHKSNTGKDNIVDRIQNRELKNIRNLLIHKVN